MGNEGKLVAILPVEEAEKACALLRQTTYGKDAAVIGTVSEKHPGTLLLQTSFGGLRQLDVLEGEGLPRIC